MHLSPTRGWNGKRHLIPVFLKCNQNEKNKLLAKTWKDTMNEWNKGIEQHPSFLSLKYNVMAILQVMPQDKEDKEEFESIGEKLFSVQWNKLTKLTHGMRFRLLWTEILQQNCADLLMEEISTTTVLLPSVGKSVKKKQQKKKIKQRKKERERENKQRRRVLVEVVKTVEARQQLILEKKNNVLETKNDIHIENIPEKEIQETTCDKEESFNTFLSTDTKENPWENKEPRSIFSSWALPHVLADRNTPDWSLQVKYYRL